MKLSMIATHAVVTVRPSDTLDKAISLMEENGVHHLPVVEGEDVVGMVSDRDLLLAVGWRLLGQRTFTESEGVSGPRRVGEIMSRPVLTIVATQTLQEAARLMVGHRIGALALVRNGKLLGIVARLDLLKHAKALADVPGCEALRHPVARHMRAKVITVGPRELIHTAAALMHNRHIRHIPVVSEGMVLGMVSDRDIRRAIGTECVEDRAFEDAGMLYEPRATVHEIMSRPSLVTSPEASLWEAAERMATHRIGALPVVRDDALVGIVSDTDVVRIVGQMEE